jgi:hypothetical protein
VICGACAWLQVSIANLRLPESPAALPEAMREAAVPTSAALVYLLQHLELFASLTGAPLLHETALLGLDSMLWQPASFWHRSPTSAHTLRVSGRPPDSGFGGAAASFMASGPSALLASASAAFDPSAEQGRRASVRRAAAHILCSHAAAIYDCACTSTGTAALVAVARRVNAHRSAVTPHNLHSQSSSAFIGSAAL